MSLGPLMVDVAGTELTPDDVAVLQDPLVGSVILFSRNYRSPRQVAALTGAIRALRTPHLIIAVDHDGGRVQRFREGFTLLPAARLLGRTHAADRSEGLRLAHAVGWLMASELRSVGVDFSFAPCVDLDHGVSEIIGDRAFGADPDAVGSLALAYMNGMREAGMAAVAKHFPGHGAVVADSHVALPIDRRDFADMEADLRPYRLLVENNLAGVMAAHVVYPGVDELPASLSRRWIAGVLRGELAFHGCVFADDLSMAGAAAFGGVLERVRLALEAGCDVLPICNDRAAVHAVLDAYASGDARARLAAASAASHARIVRMRARGEPPADLGRSEYWRATVQRVAALAATPPLVLTEGRS